MRTNVSRRFAAGLMSGLIAAAMGLVFTAAASAAPIPVQDPVRRPGVEIGVAYLEPRIRCSLRERAG